MAGSHADSEDFVHTGPDTLAGRYLRLFWQPVSRAEDLQPGQAIPIRIMSEDLTLFRGEDGEAHLVAFRCAHRGTQLSTGWVEGDSIRCRYHGWMYDGSGQCVEQPGVVPSFADKIRIRGYPVREYLGLIFAYLGEGFQGRQSGGSEEVAFPSPAAGPACPPLRRYPEFESEPCLEVYPPDVWPCNYFNRLDNFCDLGHVAYTHRASARRRGQPPGEPFPVVCVEADHGIQVISENGQATCVDMPNTNHLGGQRGGGPGERLFWRVPVDDEHVVSYCVERTGLSPTEVAAYRARRQRAQTQPVRKTFEVGDSILAGRLNIESTDTQTILSGSGGYTDIFWTEDYVAQVGQGAIADRNGEHLSPLDSGVILLRQLWRRELKALAEGRPLKQWTCSAGLGEPDRLTITR